MKRIFFCTLFAVSWLTASHTPARADSRTDHSWLWPLHEPTVDGSGKLAKGRPRRMVFNGMGDYQNFASPYYLHPGIDIMASYTNQDDFGGTQVKTLPDLTVIPVESTLVRIYDHNDCAGQSLTNSSANAHCRMYFRTTDHHFLYYFGHVRYLASAQAGEEEPNSKVRDAVAGSLGTLHNTGVTCGQSCDFAAGALGPMITKFESSSNYDHLHFTVVDREANYDNVSPFRLLATSATNYAGTRFDTVDTDSPVIGSIDLFSDGGSTSVVNNTGSCGPEVSGAVDIVALGVYDVFRNRALDVQDVPIRATSDVSNRMAVHQATYTVKNVATGTVVQQGTWYNFSSGPMWCPGPGQGTACHRNITIGTGSYALPLLSPPDSDDQSYLDHWLVWGHPGSSSLYSAPPMGLIPTGTETAQGNVEGFSTRLYDPTNTECSYSGGIQKKAALVLTNEWGTDTTFAAQSGVHTNWNTSASGVPNGRYQIDVEVSDQAGHRAGKSRLINVHNGSGALDISGAAFKDIYVADSGTDVGAVPSNVGGQAYWESPDLLVVPETGDTGSEPDPTRRVDQLVAGQRYHVWAQVHYGLCNSISGVKVALASANPSTFNSQSSWKWITSPGSTYVGPSGSPGGVSLSPGTATKWVGPFDWIPGADEVGTDGHRCLLGAITADQDPGSISDMTDVPGHNNVAQRNVQIGQALMSAMIVNPFPDPSDVGLRLTSPDMQKPYTIALDYDAAIEAAWRLVPDVTVFRYGPSLFATVNANTVNLTPVALAGFAEKPFEVSVDGPEGSTVTLQMTEMVNGNDVGGLTMTYTVPILIP
jgi:hypothetical protein